MTKLLVDCFGGDRGYEAALGGALEALRKFDDLYLLLTGDEALLRPEAERLGLDPARYEILHAPTVIGCDEKPTEAIRTKRDSSLVCAVERLRADDTVSGMVSVGSTGALVAGTVLRIGRLRGVIRPAFCPILPTMNGGIVGICDSGANVDCTPAHLLQFALMGSLYLKTVHQIENPRVALLNVGVESEKGDTLRKETYSLLSAQEGLNFCGNMESRDLLSGNYDLVVCDGFSGNVLIKSTEGACLEMLKLLKKDIMASPIRKFGALFLRGMFRKEKELMNYENYGGSVMLGAKKVVVKGHGSSRAKGIAKCIEQAYFAEAGRYTDLVEAALDALPPMKK